MPSTGLGAELIVQVAVVVRDIEATLAHYTRVFDLPTVEITESREPSIAQTKFKGKDTSGRAKLAFIRMGQTHIELIEPFGGPSAWQEFLDEHGPGVHHIAFEVPQMEQAVERLTEAGIEIVQRGKFRSGQYLYADTRSELGVVLELLQINKTN